jgi:hypothetical protein
MCCAQGGATRIIETRRTRSSTERAGFAHYRVSVCQNRRWFGDEWMRGCSNYARREGRGSAGNWGGQGRFKDGYRGCKDTSEGRA